MEQCWLRVATVALVVLSLSGWLMAQTTPQLLLTPQRLRRLQRDRERQTVRWTNFENRIESVPDSSQRGFELALYYAVTRDPARGREAVKWALAHRCDRRQAALVLDWCGELFSKAERQQLATAMCEGRARNRADAIRDALFTQITRGEEPKTDGWTDLLAWLEAGNFKDGDALYAACEYLSAVRSTQHADLREDAVPFFSALPTELLLSLTPSEVEHPDWMTHIAALALVNLDPNLEGSQYLQGWAMEEGQTIREGPGVAYEFLWANPYLPGVGYQNLDPWIYDANGRLFARTDWSSDACWIAISTHGIAGENCSSGWQNTVETFGHMSLIPVNKPCIDVPARKTSGDTAIVWKLQPQQSVFFLENGQRESAVADAAGMWRISTSAEGKVCTSPDTLKLPPAHPVRKR